MDNQQKVQPNTRYNIPDEAIIQFTGNEFIALFQHLENFVNSPGYQASIVAGQLHQVMYNKLNGAIVSGIATEIKPDTTQNVVDTESK